MSALFVTAAMYRARQEIKHQLKARGERVAQLSARDITLLAEQYLAEHRQALMEEAQAMVLASPELRKLYEREQAKRMRFNETHKICTTPEPELNQGLLRCDETSIL
jgi:hypothetical protein